MNGPAKAGIRTLAPLWSIRNTPPTPAITNPAESTVIDNCSADLCAYNAATGGFEWVHPDAVDPSVVGTTVFAVAVSQTTYSLVALDTSTGVTLWSTPLPTSSLRVLLSVQSGAGMVFVTSGDGILRAFHQRDGSLAWNYGGGQNDAPIQVSALPAVSGHSVYALTLSSLMVFDTSSGTIEWASDNNFSTPLAVAVSDGIVVTSGVTGLAAFPSAGCDAPICVPLWTTATAAGFPAVQDRTIFAAGIGAEQGNLVALNLSTGQLEWQAQVGQVPEGEELLLQAVTVAAGTAYIADSLGDLHAFAAAGCGTQTCQSLWQATLGLDQRGGSSDLVETSVAGSMLMVAVSDALYAFGETSVTPPLPSAPRILGEDAYSEAVDLSWTIPVSHGLPVLGYVLADNHGDPPQVIEAYLNQGTVSNLTNYVSYQFRVAAITAAGQGPWSPWSHPVQPQPNVGAVTDITATPGDSAITVHWKPPPGNHRISEYQVFIYPNSGQNALVNVAGSQTVATFGHLTNGVPYAFVVRDAWRGLAVDSPRTAPVIPRRSGPAQAPSTVKVTAPATILAGQPVTVTATVTSDGEPATGSVVFQINRIQYIGEPVALHDGKATATTIVLPGTYELDAQYSGSTAAAAATSSPATLTAAKTPSTTILTVSGSRTSDTPLLAHITLNSDPALPPDVPTSGGVSITDGHQVVATTTQITRSGGIPLPLLSAGAHNLSAVFNGGGFWQTSTSAPVQVTIAKSNSVIFLRTAPQAGVPIGDVEAVVAPAPPGVGIASGTVTFLANGTEFATAQLDADGKAIVVLKGAPFGATITAVYSGNSNLKPTATR